LLSRINITIISAGDKKVWPEIRYSQTLNQYSDNKKVEEKPNYICCDTLSGFFSLRRGTSLWDYTSYRPNTYSMLLDVLNTRYIKMKVRDMLTFHVNDLIFLEKQ
jgi:hypothetical protein